MITGMSGMTMKDLGFMGESFFKSLCADAGLTINGSHVDKTGWDFYIEFPISPEAIVTEIHQPALECKVQVKATSKRHRKLSVPLSNLRLMATAQIPSFYVFIEYDEKTRPQSIFVVHVDEDLISRVLKRVYEVTQRGEFNRLHKKTMTIHYNDENLLSNVDGESLKESFLFHIGDNLIKYITNKKNLLETTGFEDGSERISFTTKGIDNLKLLVDVSLGIEKQVEITEIKRAHTRFGITSKVDGVSTEGGKLEILDLKPVAEGVVKFKEDRLSAGLAFNSKLYTSPFNEVVPDELKKWRVKSEFFELTCNPYTGAANYSYHFKKEDRLEIKKLKNTIKLLSLLNTQGKKLNVELNFEGLQKTEFEVIQKNDSADFSEALTILDRATKLIESFDVTESVYITANEIFENMLAITHLYKALFQKSHLYKVEFGVASYEVDFDPSAEAAFILYLAAPVGSHVLGVVFVLTGELKPIENDRYKLISKEFSIEKKIVTDREQVITHDDLKAIIVEIENKYKMNYSVFTMFDEKNKAL